MNQPQLDLASFGFISAVLPAGHRGDDRQKSI